MARSTRSKGSGSVEEMGGRRLTARQRPRRSSLARPPPSPGPREEVGRPPRATRSDGHAAGRGASRPLRGAIRSVEGSGRWKTPRLVGARPGRAGPLPRRRRRRSLARDRRNPRTDVPPSDHRRRSRPPPSRRRSRSSARRRLLHRPPRLPSPANAPAAPLAPGCRSMPTVGRRRPTGLPRWTRLEGRRSRARRRRSRPRRRMRGVPLDRAPTRVGQRSGRRGLT